MVSQQVVNNVLTTTGLVLAPFVPLPLCFATCGFMLFIHMILTQSLAHVTIILCWVLWYLLQQFVPVLLPDPFHLTPFLAVPFILGSIWVILGVEKKRHGTIRPSTTVLFVCSYFFLSLVIANRPNPLHVTVFVTCCYVINALLIGYLDKDNDVKYLTIATGWILILPGHTSVYVLLNGIFVTFLARAVTEKYKSTQSNISPKDNADKIAKNKPKRSKVNSDGTTRKKIKNNICSTPSLALTWEILSSKHNNDDVESNQPLMNTDDDSNMKYVVKQKEDKMREALRAMFPNTN